MTALEKVLRYTRSTKSRKARLDAHFTREATHVLTRAELEEQLNAVPNQHKASFLYLPSAYSGDKSLAIVGTDLTIDRNSSATEVNRDLLLSTVGNNVPRIEFDANGVKGHLIQTQRTNLFRDSDVIGGITGITYGSVDVNLDNDWGIGLSKKGAFQPGPESNTLDATAGSSLIEGNLYTIGVFVRRTDGQLPVEGIANISTNDFCLTVAINNTSTAGTIKRDPIHVGNGVWFFQATIPAGNNAFWTGVRKRTAMSNDATEFSGIILVEGNVVLSPSDYIPTNGAAATRLKEIPLANAPEFFIPSGSWYLRWKGKTRKGTTERQELLTRYIDSVNRIGLIFWESGGGRIYLETLIDGQGAGGYISRPVEPNEEVDIEIDYSAGEIISFKINGVSSEIINNPAGLLGSIYTQSNQLSLQGRTHDGDFEVKQIKISTLS